MWQPQLEANITPAPGMEQAMMEPGSLQEPSPAPPGRGSLGRSCSPVGQSLATMNTGAASQSPAKPTAPSKRGEGRTGGG